MAGAASAALSIPHVELMRLENLRGACCPITQDVFQDPVMCADGHTYERAALVRWLRHSMLSPVTGLPLATKHVVTNHALRSLLDDLQLHTRFTEDGDHIGQSRDTIVGGRATPIAGKPAFLVWPWGSPRLVLMLRALAGLLLVASFRLPDLDVLVALATQGGDVGAALVLTCGFLLLGIGLGYQSEGLSLMALLAGLPLSALSFCCGMVSAMGGATTAELLIARALLSVGMVLCGVGLYLSQNWLLGAARTKLAWESSIHREAS